MKGTRAPARSEWVQVHVAEAARLAMLLTADPEAASRVAERSLIAALEAVPARGGPARLGDAVLTQLVRRARHHSPPSDDDPDVPEQIAVLRTLSRRRRIAVVLHHYADLSHERASVYLDCSARTAAELAAQGAASLPPDAQTDVREWLDAAPSPRASVDARAVLRRALRRRVLRVTGAAAAVALVALAGTRVPELMRAPEPPDPLDRLAEIRRDVEALEDDLPFDPDDPGAGATRLFYVDDGVVGGKVWSVRGYRDAGGNACLQLVVGYEFGSRRCLATSTTPLQAIVETDPEHRVTFVSGMVAAKVDSLHFVGPGVPFMEVPIGYEDPGSSGEPGFFGLALSDYLLPLESAEEGKDLGYELQRAKLTAIDARGRPIAEVELVLARRP